MPNGQRDWSNTSNYARVHLATHASAAGVLDPLVEQPGYLLAADPNRLLRALPSLTAPKARLASLVYQRAFDALRRSLPAERASYLEMAARQAGADDLAEQLARLEPTRPWSTRWARWQPGGDHFIAGGPMVWAVAFGELDGRAIALSGGSGGTVRVWDLATGAQRVEPLTGHDGSVCAVAFGELDGRAIALSGGEDGTVRVWDLATGAQRGEPLTGHDAWVWAVAFGELDGRAIALSGGGGDGTVRVWVLATGAQRVEPLTDPTGWVYAVAFGELDGRAIALSGGGDGTVRVYDVLGNRSRMLTVDSSVNAVAFTPPSETLVGADAGLMSIELARGVRAIP